MLGAGAYKDALNPERLLAERPEEISWKDRLLLDCGSMELL